VLTGATVTTVKVADMVRMSRSGDGAEQVPVFTIGLGGGEEITGMLQERVLGVRSGGRSWHVPVQHFLAMRGSSTVGDSADDSAGATGEETLPGASSAPPRQ
jgi:hypothetical protein